MILPDKGEKICDSFSTTTGGEDSKGRRQCFKQLRSNFGFHGEKSGRLAPVTQQRKHGLILNIPGRESDYLLLNRGPKPSFLQVEQ
mmetsp:Transcript_4350/g.6096  ORF Transcript_4350/g.6096 Transcript_4350/m.6096 type:complete len:86 (-) Transcript_4350:443-700(-)